MDIETSVRLTPEEEAELLIVLGGNAADLPTRVGDLGRASLREYVDMMLGQTVLRSPEVREQRLLQVILEANQGRVPSEIEVSQMFGLTSSGARSLLRAVLSRHRRRLADPAREAARIILAQCGAEEDGARRVAISNPVMVEYLNELLVEINACSNASQRKAERETATSSLRTAILRSTII